MDIKQYLTFLWRRLWLIVLLTMIAAGAALTVSASTQPVYSATATVLVNQAPHGDLTDQSALVTGQELARTYVELLVKRPVLEDTIASAGVAMSPDELAGSVQVALVGSTGLITIQVESPDPVLAAKLANSLPAVFAKQNGALQASRYSDMVTNLSQELDNVNKQIGPVQTQIASIPSPPSTNNMAELQQLQNQLSQLESNHSDLLQSYDSTRLAEAQATSNIQIVEPALVSTTPVRPRILRDTLLAGAVGLVLAVGLVFLMEYLDDRIRSSEQIVTLLGAPVLGMIGRFKSQEEKLLRKQGQLSLAISTPRSPIVEAFRMLRTNVRSKSVDRPLRSLLITSSVPTEGKSTIAANLAAVLAQTGLHVLLVDADLRRPSVHRMFDVSNEAGLTDMILSASNESNGLIRSSPIKSLSILPSGPIPTNPAELLDSERFRDLLHDLITQFDLVVIDSPPLLPVTDSAILAPIVDGVIIVVDVDNTRAGMLRQSKEQLEGSNTRLLGAVMNKIPPGHVGYPHYYEYYRDDKPASNGRDSKNGRSKLAKEPAPEPEDTPSAS